MNISHFFIDRPIFATVLSVIAVIIGSLSYFSLPITQYPEVAPPTIQVTATYPGASAEIVAATLATPLEQQINGVENMLYMSSDSTNDGRAVVTVTFELGTDLDEAQVLVQNRVAIAEPVLPETVRRLGVTTRKSSPNLMLVVNLYSPGGTYDQTYIANYTTLQIRDELARIDGVGDLRLFGASPYSMRIWLDPDRIAALNLTATEVLSSLRSQNLQVASGTLNQPPVPTQSAFEISVQTLGRLTDPAQFENIVVKSGQDGRIVRIKDIGRVELGAESYTTKGYLGTDAAVALPVFQRPGSNGLETADNVIATMQRLAQSFPPDLEYDIVYNPTEFISKSMDQVVMTIYEAVLLVMLVIILFLQSWRAAIIPILAIPVSLIGTFAVLSGLGYSLNTLTMFGLVLAIGIVVDDAIVVVENMERHMAKGMNARDAARITMTEVGGALVSMGIVLVAVFLPTLFIEGISGQFYQQFGITVAVATMISVLVSLTLSPALAALIFKPTEHHNERVPFRKNPLRWFFGLFNRTLERISEQYGRFVCRIVRMGAIMLVIYAGLMGLTAFQFDRVPSGFIPDQDQGYLITAIQLPPGASLTRTDAVVNEATQRILDIDGVVNAVAFTGFSGATRTNASNSAAVFAVLDEFEVREASGRDYLTVLDDMREELKKVQDAFIVVIPPPSVRGIGTGGGFKMMLQDRRGIGLQEMALVSQDMLSEAENLASVANPFSFFEVDTPQLYLDIDRERAERLGVPIGEVFDTLELFLGSAYVNDFNYLGRTFRVTAQADAAYRLTEDDIGRLRVRNDDGLMVPIGSITQPEYIAGPARVPRYNLYNAAEINGQTAAGYSTGETIAAMEALADRILPEGVGYEWTELALQQKLAGNTAAIAFMLAVLFVFLLLAAQYESWVLPLAVILIVPMCLLSSITGVSLVGMDNNILTQIGFIILIGLASKNAILIVQFAKQREDDGQELHSAASEAAQLRLRPILMTSFAFILGVVPLMLSTGAGAEMRQTLGTAVFSGMLGVTFFGLIFTPVFYVICRRLGEKTQSLMGHRPDSDVAHTPPDTRTV